VKLPSSPLFVRGRQVAIVEVGYYQAAHATDPDGQPRHPSVANTLASVHLSMVARAMSQFVYAMGNTRKGRMWRRRLTKATRALVRAQVAESLCGVMQ